MKNFFEVCDATFSSGHKHELKNINFDIPNKGEVVCLIIVWVGKTTILRTIGSRKIKKRRNTA